MKSKAYGDAPLNVNEDVWRSILDSSAAREELTVEDADTDEELEDELDDMLDGPEFVSDESDGEELSEVQVSYGLY